MVPAMSSPPWSRRTFLSATGAALCAGCATPTPENTANRTVPWTVTTDEPATGVEATVLVENLEIPWDISVAPNGDLFVSERVGRINRFSSGDLDAVLSPDDAIDADSLPPGAEGQPWWVEGGEGGTLGVAVHPSYPDRRSLYVYYTASVPDGKVNRVSRFDVDADDPAATETVVIDEIPAHKVHNGGRIAFGPSGDLWVTTGTASFDKDSESQRAADPASLAGKVLRVTPDGQPSSANPDLGPDADGRVFTYGHRNPQGLVWLADGTPVVNEHGGTGHDEINRLVAGDNYGWPNKPRKRSKYAGSDAVHPPLANSGNETWAPSGSLFYTGDAVPSWSNRMLIGALISQQVLVVTFTPPGGDLPPIGPSGRRFDARWLDDAYTLTVHPALEDALGRVRHLEQGLDGELYAITSNRDGRASGRFPREQDDVLVRLHD